MSEASDAHAAWRQARGDLDATTRWSTAWVRARLIAHDRFATYLALLEETEPADPHPIGPEHGRIGQAPTVIGPKAGIDVGHPDDVSRRWDGGVRSVVLSGEKSRDDLTSLPRASDQ
jgi:hypothetical protein